MPSRLLLVDAFNLIRRIYEARKDAMSAVIEASTQSLDRALKTIRPTHACVVFDSHDTTWRHLLYPDYKANRSPAPEVLLRGVPDFMAAFERMGVKSVMLPSYEADDVIASIAAAISASGNDVTILSTDGLFLQLLSDHVAIVNHFDGHHWREADVVEKYGVRVDQLCDLWAMAGDTSNNIKGVPRIGARTAASLLAEYGTLEEILRTEDDNASANRVRLGGDVAQRCKQLVTQKTDVEVGINLRELRLEV
ncbi:MAG: hypothetical protein KDI19_04625 [Pseudomonadales bacterium]|nr:hypothetical protein [Pseudomonadales bacterium]